MKKIEYEHYTEKLSPEELKMLEEHTSTAIIHALLQPENSPAKVLWAVGEVHLNGDAEKLRELLNSPPLWNRLEEVGSLHALTMSERTMFLTLLREKRDLLLEEQQQE